MLERYQPQTFVLKNEYILQNSSLEEIGAHINRLELELINNSMLKGVPVHEFKSIYRGESELYENTALMPTVLREFHHQNFEKNIFNGYCNNYKKNKEQDVLQNLARMQHYGFPTRLLDWTASSYVAFYFACQCPVEAEGAFYIFIPTVSINKLHPLEAFTSETIGLYFQQVHTLSQSAELHERFWKDIFEKTGVDKTIIPYCFAISPNEFNNDGNERRKIQEGLFTFHLGYVEKDKYFVAPESLYNSGIISIKQHVSRIIVPSHLKKEIIFNLKHKKIDTINLFPDVPVYSEMEYAH